MFVPLLLIRCVLASYLSRIENFFSEKTESLLWHQYYTLACACLWRQPDIVDFAEEKNCVKINEIFVLRYLILKVKERRRIHAFTTRNHLMTFFSTIHQNLSAKFIGFVWFLSVTVWIDLNRAGVCYWRNSTRLDTVWVIETKDRGRKINKTNWLVFWSV